MSSVMSWDSSAMRAGALQWNPLHHVAIKQEPMDTAVNGAYPGQMDSFHSGSPSSSSRDSNPHSPGSDHSNNNQSANEKFRPLTPPGTEASSENIGATLNHTLPNAVTPPKSLSPSPPNSEGVPSPGDISMPLDEEEPGVKTPAINSHGKVKRFNCKQCNFYAITKLAFWEHSRVHIKPERMLICPKCPFVTEYKHHLEYHMRNHFGSKPFQCKLCAYACVNKSMLSSHLKSHSNIYQYRCADCNYATKYCHSLKLHARKYNHQTAMVLNADGTPNPLPIIDVYGTRRGPKQRAQKQIQEEPPVQMPPVPQSPLPIFPNPYGVNFPYGAALQHQMLFPHNNNLNEPSLLNKIMESQEHMLMQQKLLEAAHFSPIGKEPSSMKANTPRASPYSPRPIMQSSPRLASPGPGLDALDLTNNHKPEPQPPTPQTTPKTPTATKSRRKGKAFKLERIAPEEVKEEERPASPEIPSSLVNNPSEEIEVTVDLPKFYDSDKPMSPEPDHQQMMANDPPNYNCNFCDIVFKDLVMYTMHMGYHGYNDPFTCNMCGHKSSDRVSFFVHIARSKHS